MTIAKTRPSISRRVIPLLLLTFLLSLFSIPQSKAVDAGPTFKTVSSGEHFTCGLTTLGDVYCWGANDRSQLGTSAISANSTPNKVYQVSNAVEIAAGRDFACARISDGGVACWGRGDLGQTGDGIDTTIDRIFATRVQSINTAIGIAAGSSHACVLLSDKTVKCWGENQNFQLGNETSKIETMPILVQGIPPIKQINSGSNHTCALSETGFAYCWGDNKFGQLGIGNMQILKSKPSVVLGVKKVTNIQMGYNSSCASSEGTGFSCWGWGIDGQLAETDRFNRSLPVPMTLSTITESATALVAISLGRTKSCGLLNSARSNLMYCWGTTVSTDPVSGSSAISVSLGNDHGCLVTTTGTVQCWGWNHKGQLGLGTTSNAVSSIALVSGFPDWTYWINTWSIKYEDNLGLLSWSGGTGKYIVNIDGKGIVCETLSGVKTCKFGPLESNKYYTGMITAQNSPLSYSRTAIISFTTGNLVNALDQYTLDQQNAAKAAADKIKAANDAKIIDEINLKADLAKAAVDKAVLSLDIELKRQELIEEKRNIIQNSTNSEILKLDVERKSLIQKISYLIKKKLNP